MTDLSTFLFTLLGIEAHPEDSEGTSGSTEADDSSETRGEQSANSVGMDPELAYQFFSDALGISDLEGTDVSEIRSRLESCLNSFDIIRIAEHSGDRFHIIREEEGRTELSIDPENVPETRGEASKQIIPSLHKEVDGFSIGPLSKFVYTYRQEGGREYVDDLCEFYRGKVPRPYDFMIEDCLMLSLTERTQNLSLDEVHKRKREIRDWYHNSDAFHLASLCSAGYLDKENIFWKIHEYVEEEYSGDLTYGDIFVKYVKNKPFVVFVKREDTATEVYDKFLGKSWRLKNYEYDFDFVDIRGTGESIYPTIEDTLGIINEEHNEVEYENFPTGRDLVIRVDPDSLE